MYAARAHVHTGFPYHYFPRYFLYNSIAILSGYLWLHLATSGETFTPKEPSANQDERILNAIREDFYETIVYKTDLKSLLPILVKSGHLSENRQRKLTNKPQRDAATSFQAMLMRAKSQALRRGFLLALKETATSVPSHNMLLSSLTKAAGVDMKSLEKENVVLTAASGMSTLCVRACVHACVCA